MQKVHPRVLSAMITGAPVEAARIIYAAIEATHGHKTKAAKLLGVNASRLPQWLKKLGIEVKVRKMIEREKKQGTYDAGNRGRPRKSRRAGGEPKRRPSTRPRKKRSTEQPSA